MSVSIGSSGQWSSLLSSTDVVVADFYADWCGPCKVIGPHFEKLAQEHAKPKKMAFAKINVDNQNDIAQQYGVSAMPTFKVFHKGACIDTIKGANPAALAAAITKAKQLVGSGGGQTFQSRGRTLGGQQSTRINFNLNAFISSLVSFLCLYVTSFFTLNALRAARESPFNPERRPERPQPSSSGTTGSNTAKPAAKQSNFRTLADLLSAKYPASLVQGLGARSLPVATATGRPFTRFLSTSQYLRSESQTDSNAASKGDIEKIVRDAKQRFRDTLPKDYLTAEEYELYERLYGPPLRETRPEDVGIDTHEDMGVGEKVQMGTLLRELDSGALEELRYALEPSSETGTHSDFVNQVAEKAPGYVDIVARSQREYDALQKLSAEYQVTKKQEEEERKAERLRRVEEMQVDEEIQWNEEPAEELDWSREEPGEAKRFHPLTLEGRFHGSPVEIQLPQEELVEPIRQLLERTHIQHVKKAAEDAFGGPGLPTSPATLDGMKNGKMVGVGLPPDQKHMTEIEADAFLAAYVPPAYASVMSILREVRKRVGSDGLQSRLKNGGLNVLDAGTGGAGLIAWDQLIKTEWSLLKEKGEVKGEAPSGKRTTIVAADRLRHRMKTLLDNTTFLPRLPDYEHSGPMQGIHLDSSEQTQKRKRYDVVIASHLLLKEPKDHYRQAILNNLWSLLNKDGGVLIMIEKAHPRGFEAMAHARDTIVKQFLLPQSGEPEIRPEDFNPAFHRELEPGHIIAPCTNQGSCPMYQEPGKSKGRKDFCHFGQRFVQPGYYSRVLGKQEGNQGEVEFSYVAVRRGVAKDSQLTGFEATEEAFQGYEAAEGNPNLQTLPRIIMPPIKRKGHVTLDVCTAEGKTERWTVPKSFSKLAYHDARKARWGDLWALGAKTRVSRKVRAGTGKEEGGKRASGEKKPKKVDRSLDQGRLGAQGSPATREQRNKDQKKKDMMYELMAAERRAEEEISDDIDAELEEPDHTSRR